MNLQENIKRIKEVMGIIKENPNEAEFNEIFNIEPKDAVNLYSAEMDLPAFYWKNYLDPEYPRDTSNEKENLLKIPYKNILVFNSDGLNIYLFKDDKPIAWASFSKFNDGLQTHNIVKSPNANINNLGVMIYEAIVNDLKQPLYSDLQQTEASREKIWSKLFQKYPERVVAYNMKTKKISKIINTSKDKFDPQADNNPIYGAKYKAGNVKINTSGEGDPDNQVVDWQPGGFDILGIGYNPLSISQVFQEKNLYLLKFLTDN